MTSTPPKIYLGELNDTPLGDFRLAASDLGLVAVEWADNQPELDAYLVALNIAQQLTRRVAYKKAMKQAVQRSMKAGAKGVKIALAGRLGGSEMGRREWDREGRIPLGTLRADISYGQVHAHTTYGRIGVKVWIYKGDIPVERRRREAAAAASAAAAQGVS